MSRGLPAPIFTLSCHPVFTDSAGDSAIKKGGMMKKIAVLLAVAFAATLISGCGSNVRVEITNDLGAWNIEEIFVDPAESDEWSENRISDPLEPGEVAAVSVPAGTYDIMLVDEDGDSYTRWDVEIGSDGYNWGVELSDMD